MPDAIAVVQIMADTKHKDRLAAAKPSIAPILQTQHRPSRALARHGDHRDRQGPEEIRQLAIMAGLDADKQVAAASRSKAWPRRCRMNNLDAIEHLPVGYRSNPVMIEW